MAMARKDRFRIKSQLIDALEGDEWTFQKISLLLSEFGLEPLDEGWHGPSLADVVANISDPVLVEMYALVMGVATEEVEDVVESSADDGSWKPGYVRVFLSHSAGYKEFVGRVADELAVVGIHGFVAHDTMEYTRPWQAQIEHALRSMQAFVAIVHPEFNDSAWCHQEIGWALGRRVPRYAVRMGADPAGFLGRDQWPSGAALSPKQVATTISSWISELPELGATVVDGLFTALGAAGNYVDAGATAERIAALGTLTGERFAQLDKIWWSNDQLYGGVLPTRAMEPFYKRNGRAWPPSMPEPAKAASTSLDDEEPF